MDVGIVGLPNIGKSTLFNALTGLAVEAGNYPFTTTAPHSGTADVPDPRLKQIEEFIKTDKLVPAKLQLVDMPALVQGASEGEGMGNKFLADIRNVDALLHVVRCFIDDDILHVDDSVDPLRDIETVDLELIAADSQVADSSINKAKKLARTGDKEATMRLNALEKCKAVLDELKPVRNAELSENEIKVLRSYAFLTAKPVLYLANVGEEDVADGADPANSSFVQKVKEHATEQGGQIVCVSARLESEIAELDQEDRQEMLDSLGITEPALASVARAIYDLLGLESFFTAGPIEIKAWTIRKGSKAPEAAGTIHSDIQRGFIRAEIYNVADLVQYKTEQAIKAAGKLRSEGKEYLFQDGDISHFLFNV